MPFKGTWMDLKIIILNEVKEKDKYHGITYLWNLKTWYKWTYLQNRNRLTGIETKFMVTKDGRAGKDELGVSD